MIVRTYQDASDFLEKTQRALEEHDAANSLMLGVCLRLKHFPAKIRSAPYLTTVEYVQRLVMAAVMTPPHKLVVYGARRDLGDAPAMIVRDLLAHGWRVTGVLGPSN